MENKISPYQFAINNCKNYLKRVTEVERAKGKSLDAFTMSETLSIAFCKRKEDVLYDFLK